MVVVRVRLRNFRNHHDTSVEFGDGINALLGENGGGKTNILEAISFLGLTKSFAGAGDVTVVRFGSDLLEVDGTVRMESGTEQRIRVVYSREEAKKSYEVNGVQAETLASVIGRFPVVVLSPEHAAITAGAPVERRKFLDIILSQVSSSYLESLLEYRRVVRQRNRILLEARQRGSDPGKLLDPWDEGLAAHGSHLVVRRREFFGEFETYVKRAYHGIVGDEAERVEMQYDPAGISIGDVSTREAVAEKLLARQRVGRAEDVRRGATLQGPHRDDVRFFLGGVPVLEYASQGQHKTLLVALKVAECAYLHERREERPVFLLDDVFSELDERRSARILGVATGMGQTLVTATEERLFAGSVAWNGMNRRFFVERGTCRQT